MTIRFVNQIKLTYETEGTVGWQSMCEGHDDIYRAIACKERQEAWIKSEGAAAFKAIGSSVETRIVKITKTEEVVEAPCKIEI